MSEAPLPPIYTGHWYRPPPQRSGPYLVQNAYSAIPDVVFAHVDIKCDECDAIVIRKGHPFPANGAAASMATRHELPPDDFGCVQWSEEHITTGLSGHAMRAMREMICAAYPADIATPILWHPTERRFRPLGVL